MSRLHGYIKALFIGDGVMERWISIHSRLLTALTDSLTVSKITQPDELTLTHIEFTHFRTFDIAEHLYAIMRTMAQSEPSVIDDVLMFVRQHMSTESLLCLTCFIEGASKSLYDNKSVIDRLLTLCLDLLAAMEHSRTLENVMVISCITAISMCVDVDDRDIWMQRILYPLLQCVGHHSTVRDSEWYVSYSRTFLQHPSVPSSPSPSILIIMT